MKKFVLGMVAAVGLALALAPQQASAHWAYRTAYRYDSCTCSYVCYQQRYWVEDCYDTYDSYYTPSCPSDYSYSYPSYNRVEYRSHSNTPYYFNYSNRTHQRH